MQIATAQTPLCQLTLEHRMQAAADPRRGFGTFGHLALGHCWVIAKHTGTPAICLKCNSKPSQLVIASHLDAAAETPLGCLPSSQLSQLRLP